MSRASVHPSAQRWNDPLQPRTVHVYTDGSCIQGEPATLYGHSGYGGWAAIIERGSDGYVLRGRDERTTNVRMELRAVIEGLRSLTNDHDHIVLHVDCTVIVVVHQRYLLHQLPAERKCIRDQLIWLELAKEFDRLHSRDRRLVKIELVGKGGHPIHRRAHVIAQSEARAALGGMPLTARPLTDRERKEIIRDERTVLWKRQLLERELALDTKAARAERRLVRKSLRHTPDCELGFCVDHCPVGDRRAVDPSR